MRRRALFGFPQRPPRSVYTYNGFAPVAGWTPLPESQAPSGSFTSGQNVIIHEGELRPRQRLLTLHSASATSSTPTGAFFDYNDIAGPTYQLFTSADTLSYQDGTDLVPLTYVSGVSNLPPSGSNSDLFFGTSAYLPRRDLNVLVFGNGVNPLYAWGGPSDGTGFSTLTQAPIAKDVALFDNSVVGWNVRELSYNSRFVQRAQWSVGGNIEDWTGIGSGYEDLVDMRGEGTRIFVQGDEMVVASTLEIWVGRKIGGPFRFQFSPLEKTMGIPFRKAALQVPGGIFWLGSDYMIYQLNGRSITPIGTPIQDELRTTLSSPETAFFGYNPVLRLLTFYYDGTRAWTLHLSTGQWTPQRFTPTLSASFVGPQNSAATTWAQLTGTLASQSLTYNQLLGATGVEFEGALSSNGTVYIFSDSATSDAGSAVAHDATFPVMQGVTRKLFFDEVRVALRATSASSLSIAVSPDAGASFPAERGLAVSASSNVTRYGEHFGTTGTDGAIRLRSTNGDWRLNQVVLRARDIGEDVRP